ncbi:TPA: hypothetical protein ACX6PS_002182 [Photobacterium damselae]
MNREQRMTAARERMLSRYPDRDAEEARRMESFKGLSKDELKQRFRKAAEERGFKLEAEKKRTESLSLV